MDGISLEEKLIQVLNKAHCLEKRTVGNGELARRILAIPEFQTMAKKIKPTKPVMKWHQDVPARNCPNCLGHLGYDCDFGCGLTKRQKNCPHCGQTLDWGVQP